MSGREQRRAGLLLCLVAFALASAGCSLFAGGASMRIEVEVYKGPLSKEPELQWAELIGFLQEAIDTMRGNKDTVMLIARSVGLIKEDATNLRECKSPGLLDVSSWFDPTLHLQAKYYCFVFDQLYNDATTLTERLQLIETKLGRLHPTVVQKNYQNVLGFKEDMIEILSDVAQAASESSKRAFSWSTGSIAGAPLSYYTRISMVTFIVSASEIGNQLYARADALLKQINGLDRRELPLSVQLRETDATEFVRLYEWLEAHPPDNVPFLGLGQPGSSNDRMKAVRRLFADHHWSNINTVYASGWGKGSMALYKDDIGNWNLKSFDSDPEELLRAYKNLSIKALETAVELAGKGATGGAGAGMNKLLEVAGEYFTPTPGSLTSGPGVGQFRLLSERTSSQLRNVESQVTSSRTEDTQARDDYQKAVEMLKGMRRDDPNYAKQEEAVERARKELVDNRTRVLEDIERILLMHSELVDLLAKGTMAN
jgi:hypothetical protein